MYTVHLGTRESRNLAVCVFVCFNILHIPATKSASTVVISGGLPMTSCKSSASLLPINNADESVKTTLKLLGSIVTEAAVLTSMLPVLGSELSDTAQASYKTAGNQPVQKSILKDCPSIPNLLLSGVNTYQILLSHLFK